MRGRREEARTAIESLRKYNPTFLDLENVREDIGMWDPDKDEVERFLQGLQKAGLKYGSADSAAKEIGPKLKVPLRRLPGEAHIPAASQLTTKIPVRTEDGLQGRRAERPGGPGRRADRGDCYRTAQLLRPSCDCPGGIGLSPSSTR